MKASVRGEGNCGEATIHGKEACEDVRALTNDYLAESGLMSLYEIWRKTHSSKLNRLAQTRMPGGAGGASEQSGPLSRSALLSHHGA